MGTTNMAGVPKMNWEASDLVVAWENFKRLTDFWFGGPLLKKSEPEKVNYLMIWVGDKGRDIHSTWTLTAEEQKSLATILGKFEDHVRPKTNRVFSRYKIQCRTQKDSETFEQFLTDLQILAKDCSYQEKDNMIRDAIVFGTKDPKVREKCINEGSDLTLDKAVNFARTRELSSAQIKTMEEDKIVNVIRNAPKHKVHVESKSNRPSTRGGHSNLQQQHPVCGKCARSHEPMKCPAYGKTCDKCGWKNHFAVACRSKRKNQKVRKPKLRTKNCNIVDIESEDSDINDELFVGTLQIHDIKTGSLGSDSEWLETVNVNNKPVNFQLDTGAKCNVLSVKLYKRLSNKPLQKCSTPLRSYSGHKIECVGTNKMSCSYNNSPDQDVLFYVVALDSQAVLGAQTCRKLGLVKSIYTLSPSQKVPDGIDSEFSELFTGLGCVPGEHSIKIDESVPPVVRPPWRVPIALREKVKDELDRMEKLGVVVKESKPTKWVNSLVTVLKPNGKLRLCIDPCDLNKAIQREHYPLKTIEDVASQMPGAKVFSKLDLVSGFWQLKLDEASSKLCTFNTPFGRYRYTRLPFGVKSAPEVFQRVISEMIEDLDGTEAIIDDILVWGTTQEEHDQRLRKVLERAREYNVKLGADKCEISKAEVTYMGHLLTKDGLMPDPEKVRAVKSMEKPTNVKELQTFMGFIQYLAKFIPRLSEVSSPIRVLLEKDTGWHWGVEQDSCFDKLIKMTSSPPLLQYYDSSKPVTLSVDASSKGLSAVLVQDNKPVAYASRALTETQQRYSQIERDTRYLIWLSEISRVCLRTTNHRRI